MKKETQQQKILAMHEDGFTPREMYETLGCSIGSIYGTLSKFKLKPNTHICPTCLGRYNPNLVAEAGIEPASSAYETDALPLSNSAC